MNTILLYLNTNGGILMGLEGIVFKQTLSGKMFENWTKSRTSWNRESTPDLPPLTSYKNCPSFMCSRRVITCSSCWLTERWWPETCGRVCGRAAGTSSGRWSRSRCTGTDTGRRLRRPRETTTGRTPAGAAAAWPSPSALRAASAESWCGLMRVPGRRSRGRRRGITFWLVARARSPHLQWTAGNCGRHVFGSYDFQPADFAHGR